MKLNVAYNDLQLCYMAVECFFGCDGTVYVSVDE